MPLPLTVLTQFTSVALLSALLHGNGGNDLFYINSSVVGGSSVYGGQGVDSIDVRESLSASTVLQPRW